MKTFVEAGVAKIQGDDTNRVVLRINDKNGRRILRVNFTMEEFADFILGRHGNLLSAEWENLDLIKESAT